MPDNATDYKQTFSVYLNKRVHIKKKENDIILHYNGLVLKLLDKQLFLDDDKIGPIVLSYEDISIELKRERE